MANSCGSAGEGRLNLKYPAQWNLAKGRHGQWILPSGEEMVAAWLRCAGRTRICAFFIRPALRLLLLLDSATAPAARQRAHAWHDEDDLSITVVVVMNDSSSSSLVP